MLIAAMHLRDFSLTCRIISGSLCGVKPFTGLHSASKTAFNTFFLYLMCSDWTRSKCQMVCFAPDNTLQLNGAWTVTSLFRYSNRSTQHLARSKQTSMCAHSLCSAWGSQHLSLWRASRKDERVNAFQKCITKVTESVCKGQFLPAASVHRLK